jgi:hypothetical protein
MSTDKKKTTEVQHAGLKMFEGLTNTDEPAFVTAKCEDPLAGIAYRIDRQKIGEREGYALVVRLVTPMKAEREDELVEVKAGEDVKIIVGAGLRALAEATLREPTAVFIHKTGQKPHPTKREMRINTYSKKFVALRQAKNVDKTLVEEMQSAHKVFRAAKNENGINLLETEMQNVTEETPF